VDVLGRLQSKGVTMKKLVVLAAFALAAGTAGSQACAYQRQAANSMPIVSAATEDATMQQPAAELEPAAPKVITTDEPLAPPVSIAACQGKIAKLTLTPSALDWLIAPAFAMTRARLGVETLVTGAYGTAAVLVGIAMGASRVVAAGRKQAALGVVARAGGPRVSTVVLKGRRAGSR
jgi:hypothetical protein